MDSRFLFVAAMIGLIAGCQAPPAIPVGTAPARVPAVPATTPNTLPAPAAVAPPAQRVDDARADAAAKLAAAHAKALEDLMAGRAAPAAPAAAVNADVPAPSPAAPPAVSPTAPGVTPLKADPSDAVFKPVPSLPGAVAIEPPAATPPAAVVMSQSPASPVLAEPPPPQPRPAAVSSDPVEQQLQQAARESPNDLAAQFDAQLVRFIKGEPVPAPEALARLNSEDRDVLTSLFDGLSNFRTSLRRENNPLIGKKIRPLTDMADRLRSQADLSITNAAICRKIVGFGSYEPISPARLPADRDNWPGIYYEVENFAPKLDAKNMWALSMRQDIAIYDNNGRLVWQWLDERITDTCRVRRRDWYVAKKVAAPIKLGQGTYTMKITLTDTVAGRVAETSLPLTLSTQAVPAVTPVPAGPLLPR